LLPRWSIGCIATAMILIGVLPCAAQPVQPRRDQHPWAKFPVGSWKTVQVTTETLDKLGNVTNITSTQTRTTLIAVDDDSYTLQVDVTVEVSGKRFPPQSQIVKYGYWGQTSEQPTTVKSLGSGELKINGQTLKTELQSIEVAGDEFTTESVVHYSADQPPYQLRRETTVKSENEAKSSTTTVEVIGLDLPQRVLGEVKPAAVVKTVRKHAKGMGVTVEMHCDDVPGGVVSHTAAEHTPEGEVARRSILQVVDYSIGIGEIEEVSSIVRRRKYHRARRRMDDMYLPAQPR
jgi:hypothetical protein